MDWFLCTETMCSTSLEHLMCPDTSTVLSGRNLYRKLIISLMMSIQLSFKKKNLVNVHTFFIKNSANIIQCWSGYCWLIFLPFDFVPLSINMTKHPAPSLCGVARDKAELFRERYTILQQVWIHSVSLCACCYICRLERLVSIGSAVKKTCLLFMPSM